MNRSARRVCYSLLIFALNCSFAWSADDRIYRAEDFLNQEQYEFYRFYTELPDYVEVKGRSSQSTSVTRMAKKDLAGSICTHFIHVVQTIEEGGYGTVDNGQIQNMTGNSYGLCRHRIPKMRARLNIPQE